MKLGRLYFGLWPKQFLQHNHFLRGFQKTHLGWSFGIGRVLVYWKRKNA
jgi:hypothetical protein